MHNRDLKSSVRKASFFRRRGRLVLIGLLVLLILSAGSIVVIRSTLDENRVADTLLSNVEARINKEVTYTSASLSWVSLTTFRLTIRDLVCRDQAGSPILLRIPSTVLHVSLLPILWGSVSFEKAVFSKPMLFLPPSSEIRSGKQAPTKPVPGSRLSLLRPKVANLLIESGKIVLRMHGEPTKAAETQVQNIELQARDVRGGTVKTVQVAAELITGNEKGFVEIVGTSVSNPFAGGSTGSLKLELTNGPLATLRRLLAYVGIKSPLSTGTVDLKIWMEGGGDHAKVTGSAAISQAILQPVGVFHQQTLLPHAALKCLIEFSPASMRMNIQELSLPGVNVVGTMRLEEVETGDPRLRIDLSKASLILEDLFPFIPVRLMTPEDREKLLESQPKGKILITEGSWAGKPSELGKWDRAIRQLTTHVMLERVSGFIPTVGLTLREGVGRVRLERSEIVLEKISLLVGEANVSVNGRVWDLTSVPQLDLSLMARGKIEEFRGLWEKGIIAGPLPARLGSIEELKGTIDASVALKRNTSRPEITGQAQFSGIRCQFSKLPLPLSRLEGSLAFRGSDYAVSSVNGFVGESFVEINGIVSPAGLDLSGQLKLAARDMEKLKWLPSQAKFTGKVPVGVKLGGSWSEIAFESTVDFKENRLRIGDVIAKEAGIPLAISVSGIRSAKGLTISAARIILDKSSIQVKGKVDETGVIRVSVDLPRQGLPTDALSKIVNSTFQLKPGGRVEGHAKIKVGPNLPSDLRMDVDLTCANLSTRIPRIKGPLAGITGSVLCRGQSISAVVKEGRIGRSQLTGKCSLKGFDSPKIDFTLHFPFFDTADFEAPDGSRSQASWRERKRSSPVMSRLARSQIRGLVVSPKGRMFDRAFADLRVDFEGEGGMVKIPKWQMHIAGGQVQGSGLFDARTDTQDLARLEFKGDGLLMERVLTPGGQESVLEGKTKIEGWMSWVAGPEGKEKTASKRGFFQVEVSDGKVQRFEILSKIFSLINLGSLARGRLPDIMASGLPFKQLAWKMEVVNDKWTVKDLKLASDAATIEASGMYFSDQKRMNFKVRVAPLVGVDKIVSSVVGTLLNREVKTLTTTFRVRGSYAAPDVRLIPLETLKSGGD